MKLSERLRSRLVRTAILVLALAGYGMMVGCERKTVIEDDRGHPDWHHDDHHY